jgi:hypothetical protein
MKKPAGSIILLFFGVLAGGVFCTCGIEDYIFLYPVQESNISVRLTEEAALRLPSPVSSESLYFTQFSIFYRIYVSGVHVSAAITSPEQMRTISSALYNDYNGIYPSTSNNSASTTVNTSVGSLFSGRRYFELDLDGAELGSVLDSGSQGEDLIIRFQPVPGEIPALVIRGNVHRLRRSTGNGSFNPQPDHRYFVNAPELNASANVSTTVNNDVADQSGISGPRYTYVSMYIVKVGRDTNTLSNIYSAPTFVGILMLPNEQ